MDFEQPDSLYRQPRYGLNQIARRAIAIELREGVAIGIDIQENRLQFQRRDTAAGNQHVVLTPPAAKAAYRLPYNRAHLRSKS